MQQRGSDKHGSRLDEQMKEEIEGVLRSGHPTRAEEDHEPEPVVDDAGVPATDRAAVQQEEEEESP